MSETSEIPDDVMETAIGVCDQAFVMGDMPVLIARAILAERERCAKIAEYGVQWTPVVKNQAIIDESCRLIASSIRSPDTICDGSKI